MRRGLIHAPLHLLLLALLVACGGVPGSSSATVSEESLGTISSALCAGTGVSTLTIAGISTYQGEMAGNGNWAVVSPANAVWLEYYVDNVLQSSEERRGGSGTWYFSKSNVSCGAHAFLVKAYPMVVDSAGNRTTCWTSNPKSASQTVPDSCYTCHGTAGQWAGCRGNGCAVCAEKLTNYPCYFQNHPSCVRNDTCAGQFYTCNAACPAPTAADACQSVVCSNNLCESGEDNSNCPQDCPVCGDGVCHATESSSNSCPQDCCEGSWCSDGSCCPPDGRCSDGRFCPL